MTNSLKYTAGRLGLGHRKLMQRMREVGLLDAHNLPAHPDRDKAFLVTRENRYHHPQHGLQYPRTTRVTDAGIPWLARKLGIERPLPDPQQDPRDVA
ncbi:phage antirepressor KilAC domain-containing protein [Pseudomonas sp. S9]|uniref:phage antirepressor KilAC domain-containing protein n=1 Tax=Pseudomonas sp. S9 TaxID=686578 RepID=UPI0002556FE4|nr:phage antirepressor KilAC domain-containing protein [Pseudomonas sp. S9]